MTLPELLLVLVVVAALGAMVIPRLAQRAEAASASTTRRSMETLRGVIMTDYRDDMFEALPYPLSSQRTAHPQLKYLYHNPSADLTSNPGDFSQTSAWEYDASSGRGWSGPYVEPSSLATTNYRVDNDRGFTQHYGESPSSTSGVHDPAPSDAWGNPIVLQQPVSASGGASRDSTLYARLVSAGPDGVLQTPRNVMQPTQQQLGDDLLVYLRRRP
ncbi:MAG: hypothetical protein AAFP90_20255 [Planctomycetota bacterium]